MPDAPTVAISAAVKVWDDVPPGAIKEIWFCEPDTTKITESPYTPEVALRVNAPDDEIVPELEISSIDGKLDTSL